MPQFTPGEIIINGKYRIEKLLGEGAFGEVYLATHLNLKTLRALKVLRKEGESGVGSTKYDNARRRFLLESNLGERLGSHPHIIQVKDFDEVDNLMVLALEYAPGGSLQKRLEDLREEGKPMSVADSLRIAAEIAEGLSALHGLDMVHRDVKPGNILFDKQGHAKLADFGLVQVPHGETRRDELSMPPPHPGTGGYMSPEQATPPFDMLTTASDIYALGAVLFEMLTGRLQHMLQGTRPSDLRPEVPAELDDLVLRMLAQHPQERPRNGSEAARLLREIDLPRQLETSPDPSRATLRAPIPAGLVECPICGSYNDLKDTFRCKGCGRAQLCREHRDQGTYLCEDCERARKPAEEKARLEDEEQARKAAEEKALEKTRREIVTYLKHRVVVKTQLEAEEHARISQQECNRLLVTLALGVEMEFVRVPAGKFTMGSGGYDNPAHTVYLDEYWIGRYPVTNAQYAAFVKASRRSRPLPFHWVKVGAIPAGLENHPVVNVSWEDAQAFCAWLSRVSGQKIILTSEAQWEKAARGTDGRAYPWGNQAPDATRCNFREQVKSTTRVGQYSPLGDSPYGCADMAGNVWQWCADWYDASYYGKSPQLNPAGPASGNARVLRGGSWYYNEYLLRSSNRFKNAPDFRVDSYGFRCARLIP